MAAARRTRKEETAKHLLPEEFRDLERFVPRWALASDRERNRQRLSASMEEVQALYDAMLPRIEGVLGYLNQLPLDRMPEEARRLFLLSFSFAEVAPAVELFKQPSVIDGFDPARFRRFVVAGMTRELPFLKATRSGAE